MQKNNGKLSFRIKGEIKVFQDTHKLKESMITKLALQKILEGETR
jgi:hypothetical protein